MPPSTPDGQAERTGWCNTVVVGNHTQGLGIVRSAAATPGSTWMVSDSVISLARFSRHLSGYTRLGHGTLRRLREPRAADELLEALLAVPLDAPSVLLGVDEDIVSFIHRRRPQLQSTYVIPHAPLERIYDKYLFNLLLPETARVETRLLSETGALPADEPRGFILKGRQGNAFRDAMGRKALRCDRLRDPDRRALARLDPEQVLVQRIVESDRPVVSLCSFSVEGRAAGVFQYEKLRQHPDRFGTGTYLRSVRVEAIEPLAASILETLGYTGISEIEFVYDREHDRYRVIEMNPRTWKSVHFASRCGENLVARYLTFASTGSPGAAGSYEPGRYWVDLATDLPQLLRERRLERYARRLVECTWERSDPWPAVALWTLFPAIALEKLLPVGARLPGRRARAGQAAVTPLRGGDGAD